ncbi:microfibrillar-associated protein [Cystoisospora suis]|uniref:Microfibrillar-associated protein n=1 Tax=Cystoisospora suis TaxID=483139 RepID=A0A2C6LAV3_9APIC|nr:microfibrillar-associated protein [Cystoisospora suis]
MSAADIHSILYRGEDPLKQKFEPQKEKKVYVPRYWPGKVPEKGEDEDYSGGSSDEESLAVKQQRMQAVLQENRRLHRLARAVSTVKPNIEERRQIHEAIIVEAEKDREALERRRRLKEREKEDEKEEEEKEEEENDEARERRRQAALQRRREEEKLLEEQQSQLRLDEEEEDEESSSSAYSTDSDDYDDPASTVLHKPVFVPKEKRETVRERERQEAEELKRQEEEDRKLAERKRESKKMLYEALQKEEEEMRTHILKDQKNLGENEQEEEEEIPDDTDGLDAEAEYEAWKARELHRIKRDQEERQAREKFLEALERRRNMTEEERRLDDRQLDAMQPRREVKYKYQFMQKYYHRGAFFQDLARSGEEPLYLRDYNAPVGEDNWDKKILPQAMRVRRGEFGRQGRTKHTHLVDVDTTDFSSAWAFNSKIKEKTDSQLAGRKGAKDFDRPAAKPRK